MGKGTIGNCKVHPFIEAIPILLIKTSSSKSCPSRMVVVGETSPTAPAE